MLWDCRYDRSCDVMYSRFGKFILSSGRDYISIRNETNEGKQTQQSGELPPCFTSVRGSYEALSGNIACIKTITFSGIRFGEAFLRITLEVVPIELLIYM